VIAVRQLRALLRLRWQMVRSASIHATLLITPPLVLVLMYAAIASADGLKPEVFEAAISAAAPAFLGFGLLAVIAPLTAGGGSEVMPADQLVAYPVRPSTQFLASLTLAPLNLVWVLQLLVLTAEPAYLTRDGGSLARGGLTTAAFVIASTAGGQAIAWFVVGVRQSRRGRLAVRGTLAALLLGALVLARLGRADDLVDLSPAPYIVRAVGTTDAADPLWWGLTLGLVVAGVVSLLLGSRACGWALRRPLDAAARGDDRNVRRRTGTASPLRTLVAIDRGSVWRAVALRRGALVLAILPGMAAAGAAVPWRSLAALPGLVAAGAGLLFGINAFCLDGSGALWLASLPHNPRLVARAKVIVLTEIIVAAVLLAAVAGAVRAPDAPTHAELAAVVMSALTCTVAVIAICLRLSVNRPHRADLRGPRDAVAPPGALVAASVKLAGSTALIGMTLGASTGPGVWQLPVLLAAPVLAWGLLSARASLRRYDDPLVRARVVQVVAAG